MYVAKALIACALAVISIKLFQNQKSILFMILSSILMLLYLSDTNKNILFYLLCSLAGPIAEIVIMKIANNTWEYKNPDFLGIPFWLLPLWGIAAGGVLGINEFMDTIKNY